MQGPWNSEKYWLKHYRTAPDPWWTAREKVAL